MLDARSLVHAVLIKMIVIKHLDIIYSEKRLVNYKCFDIANSLSGRMLIV